MKKRIIALALGALLTLSGGCRLITVDEEKAAALDNAKILIEYKDIDINKEAVTLKMNADLAQQGMTIADLSERNDTSTWDSFRESIIKEMAAMQIALEKAAELGLDKLTDEEVALIDENYSTLKTSVESNVEFYVQMAVDNDSSLNYDEEYQRQLEAYYNMIGYKADTCREQMEKEFIFDKVWDHYTKDITVTDQEVKDSYDSSLNIQKSNISIDPKMIETQLSFSGQALYYPEGYMKVRHILIRFDAETRSAATAAYGKDDTTEYDSIIAKALPTIQSKLDDIKTRLEAGEDFSALMDEYNEDTAFIIEPYKSEGIVRGPYSNVDIPGYLDAMAKLTNESQYSEPVITYDGAYIIQCVKPLAGEIPFEDVKEKMTASMIASNKETEWYNVSNGWIDAALADGTLKMFPDKY